MSVSGTSAGAPAVTTSGGASTSHGSSFGSLLPSSSSSSMSVAAPHAQAADGSGGFQTVVTGTTAPLPPLSSFCFTPLSSASNAPMVKMTGDGRGQQTSAGTTEQMVRK